MNNFIKQFKNDLRINKKTLLSQIMLFLIIDFLAIIAFFIFKHQSGVTDLNFITFELDGDISQQSVEIFNNIWILIGMGVVSFVGFVMLISSISLGSSALNLDHSRKCEIFYRSHPISIWTYASSKYMISVFVPFIIMLGIGLFNLLLVIPFLVPIFRFDLFPSLQGLFSAILIYMRSIMILGSIGFLASAVFREKAFMKLLLVIVTVQILFAFIHFSFDVPLLNLFGYIIKLINPLQNFSHITNLEQPDSLSGLYSFLSMRNLLFNWHCLLQIAASALFFITGVFVYSRKEIN
ncbi:MAG: hypothetical protein K9N06_07300 [Candidatus Cloacimonetes bacterium]|nr:hypothetical protein [Candidatus Cloacimonadota bacterium]